MTDYRERLETVYGLADAVAQLQLKSDAMAGDPKAYPIIKSMLRNASKQMEQALLELDNALMIFTFNHGAPPQDWRDAYEKFRIIWEAEIDQIREVTK